MIVTYNCHQCHWVVTQFIQRTMDRLLRRTPSLNSNASSVYQSSTCYDKGPGSIDRSALLKRLGPISTWFVECIISRIWAVIFLSQIKYWPSRLFHVLLNQAYYISATRFHNTWPLSTKTSICHIDPHRSSTEPFSRLSYVLQSHHKAAGNILWVQSSGLRTNNVRTRHQADQRLKYARERAVSTRRGGVDRVNPIIRDIFVFSSVRRRSILPNIVRVR